MGKPDADADAVEEEAEDDERDTDSGAAAESGSSDSLLKPHPSAALITSSPSLSIDPAQANPPIHPALASKMSDLTVDATSKAKAKGKRKSKTKSKVRKVSHAFDGFVPVSIGGCARISQSELCDAVSREMSVLTIDGALDLDAVLMYPSSAVIAAAAADRGADGLAASPYYSSRYGHRRLAHEADYHHPHIDYYPGAPTAMSAATPGVSAALSVVASSAAVEASSTGRATAPPITSSAASMIDSATRRLSSRGLFESDHYGGHYYRSHPVFQFDAFSDNAYDLNPSLLRHDSTPVPVAGALHDSHGGVPPRRGARPMHVRHFHSYSSDGMPRSSSSYMMEDIERSGRGHHHHSHSLVSGRSLGRHSYAPVMLSSLVGYDGPHSSAIGGAALIGPRVASRSGGAGGASRSSSSSAPSKPMIKKYRDVIYAGNLERMKSYIKTCAAHGIPQIYFGTALMSYSHRMISPLGLACRRAHIDVARFIIKECICDYLDEHCHWPTFYGKNGNGSKKDGSGLDDSSTSTASASAPSSKRTATSGSVLMAMAKKKKKERKKMMMMLKKKKKHKADGHLMDDKKDEEASVGDDNDDDADAEDEQEHEDNEEDDGKCKAWGQRLMICNYQQLSNQQISEVIKRNGVCNPVNVCIRVLPLTAKCDHHSSERLSETASSSRDSSEISKMKRKRKRVGFAESGGIEEAEEIKKSGDARGELKSGGAMRDYEGVSDEERDADVVEDVDAKSEEATSGSSKKKTSEEIGESLGESFWKEVVSTQKDLVASPLITIDEYLTKSPFEPWNLLFVDCVTLAQREDKVDLKYDEAEDDRRATEKSRGIGEVDSDIDDDDVDGVTLTSGSSLLMTVDLDDDREAKAKEASEAETKIGSKKLVEMSRSSGEQDKRKGRCKEKGKGKEKGKHISGSTVSGPPAALSSRSRKDSALVDQFDVVEVETLVVSRRRLPKRVLSYLKTLIINAYDGDKRTPLSHAVEKGHADMVKWLLENFDTTQSHSCDVSGGSGSDSCAASTTYASAVRTVGCDDVLIDLEKGGEHHDEFWTPLHYAARYGHGDIIELLIRHGADINALTSKKMSTALHLACATGNLTAVKILLKYGAKTDLEDMYLCTPLSLAIHFQEKEVQQALFSTGQVNVSSHDARRLKRDDHMFRRFYWIKLARRVRCGTPPPSPPSSDNDEAACDTREEMIDALPEAGEHKSGEMEEKAGEVVAVDGSDRTCETEADSVVKEECSETKDTRTGTSKTTNKHKEMRKRRGPLKDLHTDLWCLVCGYLSCYDLLINVRLVCYGLLVAVHHPALRRRVNYVDSMPKVADYVDYSAAQKILVLRRPSREFPTFRSQILTGMIGRPFIPHGICDRDYWNRNRPAEGSATALLIAEEKRKKRKRAAALRRRRRRRRKQQQLQQQKKGGRLSVDDLMASAGTGTGNMSSHVAESGRVVGMDSLGLGYHLGFDLGLGLRHGSPSSTRATDGGSDVGLEADALDHSLEMDSIRRHLLGTIASPTDFDHHAAATTATATAAASGVGGTTTAGDSSSGLLDFTDFSTIDFGLTANHGHGHVDASAVAVAAAHDESGPSAAAVSSAAPVSASSTSLLFDFSSFYPDFVGYNPLSESAAGSGGGAGAGAADDIGRLGTGGIGSIGLASLAMDEEDDDFMLPHTPTLSNIERQTGEDTFHDSRSRPATRPAISNAMSSSPLAGAGASGAAPGRRRRRRRRHGSLSFDFDALGGSSGLIANLLDDSAGDGLGGVAGSTSMLASPGAGRTGGSRRLRQPLLRSRSAYSIGGIEFASAAGSGGGYGEDEAGSTAMGRSSLLYSPSYSRSRPIRSGEADGEIPAITAIGVTGLSAIDAEAEAETDGSHFDFPPPPPITEMTSLTATPTMSGAPSVIEEEELISPLTASKLVGSGDCSTAAGASARSAREPSGFEVIPTSPLYGLKMATVSATAGDDAVVEAEAETEAEREAPITLRTISGLDSDSDGEDDENDERTEAETGSMSNGSRAPELSSSLSLTGKRGRRNRRKVSRSSHRDRLRRSATDPDLFCSTFGGTRMVDDASHSGRLPMTTTSISMLLEAKRRSVDSGLHSSVSPSMRLPPEPCTGGAAAAAGSGTSRSRLVADDILYQLSEEFELLTPVTARSSLAAESGARRHRRGGIVGIPPSGGSMSLADFAASEAAHLRPLSPHRRLVFGEAADEGDEDGRVPAEDEMNDDYSDDFDDEDDLLSEDLDLDLDLDDDDDDLDEDDGADDSSSSSSTLPTPKLTDDQKDWRIHEYHCAALAFTADFAPSSLRKIRLTGHYILSQPIITCIGCLSFIVHLEINHFCAQSMADLDLSCLKRLNKLRMVRQLKVFPIMRSTAKEADIDAKALSAFISAVGSTALTVGLKWERSSSSSASSSSGSRRTSSSALIADGSDEKRADECEEKAMEDIVTDAWREIFVRLPDNIRSLRLHFGEQDSQLDGRAVRELCKFDNIKCFTLHGDPGLSVELEAWASVFKSWSKLRYVVLGHRGALGQLMLPREILEALPKTLPELALNVSFDSIDNVIWYLENVVEPKSFLRINLHVTHELRRNEMMHRPIPAGIVRCLSRFPNLETAYLKCGIVTIEQINALLTQCEKLSFVGFGIDTNSKNEKAIRELITSFEFDKTVVKNEINWLIAVKSDDKYLLDPSRCIHPVLEAFD